MVEIASNLNQATVYSPSAKTQNAVTSDFQTFIQMLTTQAENQDPLNPMDSAEYASQLASFSSVEQQVKRMICWQIWRLRWAPQNLAQLSAGVGMDARTAAPVQFEGLPVTLHPLPARLADEAFLVVFDDTDTEVQRLPLGLDGEPVDGLELVRVGRHLPRARISLE
jgi:flagellar basal-body rod modification protein FlgD